MASVSPYYHGVAELPGGWAIQRVRLDTAGFDVFGWQWGRVWEWQPGARLWHLSDGVDSCTIVAPSPVVALAIVMADGWPPVKTKRYNWSYRPC